MNENTEDSIDPIENWRDRASQLEELLARTKQEAEERLIQAELKSEARRAGIVDLDALKLLDSAGVTIGEDGHPIGVEDHIARFKAAKPWLFVGRSSTNTANPPRSQPIKLRSATEMSEDEYHAARAALLRNAG